MGFGSLKDRTDSEEPNNSSTGHQSFKESCIHLTPLICRLQLVPLDHLSFLIRDGPIP